MRRRRRRPIENCVRWFCYAARLALFSSLDLPQLVFEDGYVPGTRPVVDPYEVECLGYVGDQHSLAVDHLADDGQRSPQVWRDGVALGPALCKRSGYLLQFGF